VAIRSDFPRGIAPSCPTWAVMRVRARSSSGIRLLSYTVPIPCDPGHRYARAIFPPHW